MKSYKVTIVEDDEVTALNLKLSLEKQNYEVISTFHNVKDTLQNLPSNLPDVILIDISLETQNDGIDLATALKEFCSLPFIYLTSYSDEHIMDEAKVTNPYGYIVKPFHPDALHASLQMALHRFENEQQTTTTLQNNLDIETLLEQQTQNGITIAFANNYLFNIETNELFFQQNKIRLKDIERYFLRLLIAKRGEIVSADEIADYIHKYTQQTITTGSLVWRLRNKLEDDIIKNSSDGGYYIED